MGPRASGVKLTRARADYDYKFLCIPKWPYPICCGGKARLSVARLAPPARRETLHMWPRAGLAPVRPARAACGVLPGGRTASTASCRAARAPVAAARVLVLTRLRIHQVSTRQPPTFFPLDEKMAFIPAAILGFQHMIAMLIGACMRRRRGRLVCLADLGAQA